MFAPPKIFSMPTPVQLIGHLKILAYAKKHERCGVQYQYVELISLRRCKAEGVFERASNNIAIKYLIRQMINTVL